jgi:hypothetical protein
MGVVISFIAAYFITGDSGVFIGSVGGSGTALSLHWILSRLSGNGSSAHE